MQAGEAEREQQKWNTDGRDLAEVIELVRATGAPRALDDQPHPFVREKYREL